MGENMKKFLLSIITLFICVVCYGTTFNQYWIVDDNAPIQTTCTTGGDIILPAPPTKYGYDFIGWEQSQFRRIEYLESTGTQYIDTPYPAVYGYKYIVKAAHKNIDPQIRFVGSVATENCVFLGVQNKELFFRVLSQSDIKTIAQAHTDTVYVYELKLTAGNNILNISEEGTQNIYTGVIHSSGNLNKNTFYLFGTNYDGTALLSNTSGTKIYEYKVVSSNGDVLLNLVPVLDYNGIPCMYDKVEQKFYYNAGTGDFIAGPTI